MCVAICVAVCVTVVVGGAIRVVVCCGGVAAVCPSKTRRCLRRRREVGALTIHLECEKDVAVVLQCLIDPNRGVVRVVDAAELDVSRLR